MPTFVRNLVKDGRVVGIVETLYDTTAVLPQPLDRFLQLDDSISQERVGAPVSKKGDRLFWVDTTIMSRAFSDNNRRMSIPHLWENKHHNPAHKELVARQLAPWKRQSTCRPP